MKYIDCYETSLPIALPEELGILGNVFVHITLSNGQYFPLKADLYPNLRYYSNTGEEWPKIYDEINKQQQIFRNPGKALKEFNTSVFGIIYTCYNINFLKGRIVVTFTSWKEEMLSHYYTEKIYFDLTDEMY